MSVSDRSPLRPQQQQAAELLAVEPNVDKVASVVGVSVRTLRRWRALPDFQAAQARAHAGTFGRARAIVLASSIVAAKTTIDLMRDPTTPHGVRARIARDLLDLGRDFMADDHEARLAELERKVTAWHDEEPQPGAHV